MGNFTILASVVSVAVVGWLWMIHNIRTKKRSLTNIDMHSADGGSPGAAPKSAASTMQATFDGGFDGGGGGGD